MGALSHCRPPNTPVFEDETDARQQLLGLFGAALFYGDSMITPAISVLSAVEGLELAFDGLEHWVVPLALIVLVLLFHGITAADLPEVLFGFGMCCIGALGLFTVARVAGSDGRPAIPRHAVG